MSNRNTFETQDVVTFYRHLTDLQAPEQTILNVLRDDLHRMKMLDIGVGGGRTTSHFANLTHDYVGIDYSTKMVDTCKAKFHDSAHTLSFLVCDATSMRIFSDDCFDFVLFSFNGIDYMTHEDRMKAMSEIRRVCAPNGRFCFSTHNLQSIDSLYKIKTWNPLKIIYGLFVRNVLMIVLNGDRATLRRRRHAIIRDSTHWFRLRTYYVKPSEQLDQLRAAGFTDIQVYSLSGSLLDAPALETSTDSWLYYLCRRA